VHASVSRSENAVGKQSARNLLVTGAAVGGPPFFTHVRIDTCTGTGYGIIVIRTFRHRGFKRLFEDGDPSKIGADQLNRIADVLAHLDRALHPSDLDLPGYRLHPLKGRLRGVWSVTISSNWRIVFRFQDGDAFDVDLMDYH
jgi:proteic killer suppression protein